MLGVERLAVLLVDRYRVVESSMSRSEGEMDKDNHSRHDFPFTYIGKVGSVLPADCYLYLVAEVHSCFGSD
jgi:hypothetical protein